MFCVERVTVWSRPRGHEGVRLTTTHKARVQVRVRAMFRNSSVADIFFFQVGRGLETVPVDCFCEVTASFGLPRKRGSDTRLEGREESGGRFVAEAAAWQQASWRCPGGIPEASWRRHARPSRTSGRRRCPISACQGFDDPGLCQQKSNQIIPA